MLMAASVLLLQFAIIHGPGRGLTAFSADHPHAALLYYIRIAVYSMFLVGACLKVHRTWIPAVIIGLGLMGRAVLELAASVARGLVENLQNTTEVWVWSALVFLFYFASFIRWPMPGIPGFRLSRGA